MYVYMYAVYMYLYEVYLIQALLFILQRGVVNDSSISTKLIIFWVPTYVLKLDLFF